MKRAILCAALLLAGGFSEARADSPNEAPRLPAPPSDVPRPDPASVTAELSLTFDVAILGGTLMEWSAPGEAGNAYGLSVGLDYGDFRAALSFAGVAPDSRAAGAFEVVWAEGWWRPFGRFFDRLGPYVVAGLGLAAEDSLGSQADDRRIRWSRAGAQFVAMVGVGAAYGAPEGGMFVAFDVRGYNISHGGMVVTAGYRF